MDLGPLRVGPAGLGSAGLGPVADPGAAPGAADAAHAGQEEPSGRGSAILAIVELHGADGGADRYLVPFVVDDGTAAAREARDGDGAWRALAVAMSGGRVLPTAAGGALVCRPGLALPSFAPGGAAEIAAWSERPLGADQSNTSAVLGERLLLKVFRRVLPGLDPDLELTAYLAEERRSRLVPALAGAAEHVAPDGRVSSVAMLQELVPDAEDAYETTAERLAGWVTAPGVVALEYATEDAATLGAVLGELHAELAAAGDIPDFTPREATADDRRAWRDAGRARLDVALGLLGGGPAGADLARWRPAIEDRLADLERAAAPTILTRIHGDLHLGQVLRTPGGFVIVDFEGEPMRSIEERRALATPMRDVATLLRSFDHVSTSAERRAGARGWSPDEHTGLDLAAWRRRSRERLLRTYAAGLRRASSAVVLDERLVAALEVAKECDEFVYAATYLPDWIWAPRAGMRRLLEGDGEGRAAG